MMDTKETMRNNPPSGYTYLDQVFESEINNAIKLTDYSYSRMLFREAMKTGFYDLQVFSMQYVVCSIQYVICGIYMLQVFSMHYIVCSIQYVICGIYVYTMFYVITFVVCSV